MACNSYILFIVCKDWSGEGAVGHGLVNPKRGRGPSGGHNCSSDSAIPRKGITGIILYCKESGFLKFDGTINLHLWITLSMNLDYWRDCLFWNRVVENNPHSEQTLHDDLPSWWWPCTHISFQFRGWSSTRSTAPVTTPLSTDPESYFGSVPELKAL